MKAKCLYTNGRLTQIRQFTRDSDDPDLWSLNLLDASGRATSKAYGNGMWLQSEFDPLTGLLTARRSGAGQSETNVQQLAYRWDEAGNLTARLDLNPGRTETLSTCSGEISIRLLRTNCRWARNRAISGRKERRSSGPYDPLG